MSLARGFVRSIEVREDGYTAVAIQAVQGNDQRRTFYVPALDGDLSKAHRRMAQLGLLRDALSGTLPVEIQYESTDVQGDIIDDVSIYASRSIDGRRPSSWLTGVVVDLAIVERGPESETSPFVDEPDEALVTLLLDNGSLEALRVDLQRRYEQTGHAIVAILRAAAVTRREVEVATSGWDQRDVKSPQGSGATVVAVRQRLPHVDELQRVVAFIERVFQSPESVTSSEPRKVSHARVTYTTAPEQNPAGDRSENGSFLPVTEAAWVHQDSPLLARLLIALEQGLQVELSLLGDEIHEVDLIAPFGSAARPIWIHFRGEPICDPPASVCANDPTIQPVTSEQLGAVPHGILWSGEAYFAPGIWRLVVRSKTPVVLRVDGHDVPCSGQGRVLGAAEEASTLAAAVDGAPYARRGVSIELPGEASRLQAGVVAHRHLDGVHRIEMLVRDYRCGAPFQTQFYRIR